MALTHLIFYRLLSLSTFFLFFPPQGQDSPSAVHVIFNYLINVQSCIPVNTIFIVVITLFC